MSNPSVLQNYILSSGIIARARPSALNGQCFDANKSRFFTVSLSGHDKVFCSRAISGNSIYPNIVALACLLHGLHNVLVLSVPVPIDWIQDLDLGARGAPVPNQLGNLFCSSDTSVSQ